MSNKNRKIRIELARIYGSGCFFLRSGAEKYIERLGTIRTYRKYKEGLKFKSKKMKVYEDIMTFHHLVHKSEGGPTSVENGAILNAIAHQYIHSLPRSQEEIINDYIREWKKQIDKKDYTKAEIEFTDDICLPFEVCGTELNFSKILDKQKRREKREMQRIKKEFEDR